jgi:hypothetical protein
MMSRNQRKYVLVNFEFRNVPVYNTKRRSERKIIFQTFKFSEILWYIDWQIVADVLKLWSVFISTLKQSLVLDCFTFQDEGSTPPPKRWISVDMAYPSRRLQSSSTLLRELLTSSGMPLEAYSVKLVSILILNLGSRLQWRASDYTRRTSYSRLQMSQKTPTTRWCSEMFQWPLLGL